VRRHQICHCLCYKNWRIKRKIRTYRYHDICIAGIAFPVEPKRFSKNSFNPVPGNCSFQLSADTYADPVVTTVSGSKNNAKALSVQPSAMFVNVIKFPVLPQATVFRKRKPVQ
jgi:hypothetical protein